MEKVRDWLKANWRYIAVAWGILGWVFAVAQAIRDGTPIPPPPPIIVENRIEVPAPVPPAAAADTFGGQAEHGQGWVPDPDEVAAIAATMQVKVFSDTPAGKNTDPQPKSVYGWKAYEQLYARPPPIKNQGQVGSCVSFGTNTAVERTLAAEIVRRKGTAAEWSRFVEEATYGGSRVEIGGGRIRGDGSIGAWAAQFVTKWGMVPRKTFNGTDLTTYSENRCREWGRSGVPAEFEDIARQFPVKSTVQVKVWEEAKTALSQGYFIAVCSNQGFTSQRDANGVCKPSGSWAHCMALDGYHTDESGREYGHIVNSWGESYHKGPVGWGNPNPDGFWADWQVIDRMLKASDSWAFSGVTGFPARRPIDWLIQAPHRDRDRLAIRFPHPRPSNRPDWSLAP